MFDLVNDIEQYPKFLPGCAGARVINRSDEELVGELTLSKAGVSQTLVTRNLLERPSSIRMELVEGNFSAFDAHWTFTPINEKACRVSLIMEFKFKSSLLGRAEKLFSALEPGGRHRQGPTFTGALNHAQKTTDSETSGGRVRSP
ncbi:MAG: type II toxin-antitoxin system RatA family toxin [Pseudohongiellaceae bacterium]